MSLLDQIVSEFAIIATEDPQRVYPADVTDNDDQCLYVQETADGSLAPACVVGYWLHRWHRVPLDVMHEHESNARELIHSLIREGHLPAVWMQQLGDREWAFLRTVQQQQDRGTPWGEAIATAKHNALLGVA